MASVGNDVFMLEVNVRYKRVKRREIKLKTSPYLVLSFPLAVLSLPANGLVKHVSALVNFLPRKLMNQ